MKKTIFAATAAIALLGAMPAAAADWYAQVNAGYSVGTEADTTGTFDEDGAPPPMSAELDVDLENGFAVGASAGVAIGNGLRVEGEGLYTTNDVEGIEDIDIDSVEVNHMAFLVNVIYDFNVGSVQPYIGAGVGFGSLTLDVDNESVHDEGTAWQVKAGASFPVNDTLTLDVGYRYLQMAEFDEDLGTFDLDGDTGTLGLQVEPTAHIITVGARFKLGGAAS